MRHAALLALLLAAACQKPAHEPPPPANQAVATAPAPKWTRHDADSPASLAVNVDRARIVIEADGIARVYPDVGGGIDGVGILGAFDALGSVNDARLIVADDTSYQRVVTTMDWLTHATRNIGIDAGGDGSGTTSTAPPDPKTAAIVVVTPTEILLDHTPVVPTAQATGTTIAELDAALAAHTPSSGAVIQADATTSGALVNRVIRTLQAHGFDQILFAIKT
jgi:hypothetical protein